MTILIKVLFILLNGNFSAAHRAVILLGFKTAVLAFHIIAPNCLNKYITFNIINQHTNNVNTK